MVEERLLSAATCQPEVDGLDAGLWPAAPPGRRSGAPRQLTQPFAAVDQLPQLVGAALGQGVCWLQAATQVHHVFGAVAAFDPLSSGVSAQSFSIAWICCSPQVQCHISSLFHCFHVSIDLLWTSPLGAGFQSRS